MANLVGFEREGCPWGKRGDQGSSREKGNEQRSRSNSTVAVQKMQGCSEVVVYANKAASAGIWWDREGRMVGWHNRDSIVEYVSVVIDRHHYTMSGRRYLEG